MKIAGLTRVALQEIIHFGVMTLSEFDCLKKRKHVHTRARLLHTFHRSAR